jgi:hypothetical protein
MHQLIQIKHQKHQCMGPLHGIMQRKYNKRCILSLLKLITMQMRILYYLNIVGCALCVPIGMAPRGDIDGDFDANGGHVGGQCTHFGAYDYHHHGNNDDHHVRPYGDPYC